MSAHWNPFTGQGDKRSGRPTVSERDGENDAASGNEAGAKHEAGPAPKWSSSGSLQSDDGRTAPGDKPLAGERTPGQAATPSPRPSVESLVDAYRDALARWHTGAPNPLTTIAADMARAAVLAEHERQVREARLAAIEDCRRIAQEEHAEYTHARLGNEEGAGT